MILSKVFFYFILLPALLPVYFIFRYIYKMDKVEREPLDFVLKILVLGALFSLPCAPVERFAVSILGNFLPKQTLEYALAENVICVGFVEEFFKWLVIWIFVWKNSNFDWRFDGIVYAATSSLGFAALENILYIISFGTSVSVSRAIFAIPGHTCFGVFMGFFLSRSKDASLKGNKFASFILMLFALLVPAIIHGTYDFLLSEPASAAGYTNFFILYVIVLDFLAWSVIRHEFKTDRKLGRRSRYNFMNR